MIKFSTAAFLLKVFGISSLIFLNSEFVSGQSGQTISDEKRQHKMRIQEVSSLAGLNFKAVHYRCEWSINPAVRYISGRVRCDFSVKADTASLFWFDFSSQLTVDSVKFRGESREAFPVQTCFG
jgi:hypothetical protein